MSETWDYIVVGAGSAGCVVANRLSADPATRVLVLEAGGSDRNPLFLVPAGILRLSDSCKWLYPTEPDETRHGKAEILECGRVIGGSSSINGMVWVRGNAGDFDAWADAGCVGWDWASVLPLFRRMETFEGGTNALRGGSGPQHVSFLHLKHQLTDAFVTAAQQAGYVFNEDYNGAEQAGVAFGQVSQRRGLRDSAARSFLHPAEGRRNLKVLTHIVVRRIVIEGDRAVGVEYETGGRVHVVRCDREIVLSAGAVGSPRILLLSGIGPPSQLTPLGIPVHADVPGVGSNFQDHFGIALYYETDVKTLNREFTPWDVIRGGLDLVLRGRGTATAAFAHAIILGSVSGDVVDYKAIFAPYGLTDTEHQGGGLPQHHMMKSNAVTIRPTVLRPVARGTITLRSDDPHAFPVIRHRYAADTRDVATLIEVSRRVREIVDTEPLKSHIVRELLPGGAVQTDAEWEEAVRARAYPGKHPGGTCKMGVDEMAVVSPELRVRGVNGLRVIDLSIVPRLPTGNTNAAAMMIGERGSDLILGRSVTRAAAS